MKEITAAGGSTRYEVLVERVCDDLIENVNNQIDLHKRQISNPEGIPIRRETFQQDKLPLRTDNTMLKPQLQWWTTIDNSYYHFIPSLSLEEGKPSGTHPIPEEITRAIRDKMANPMKYRQF